MKTKHKGMYPCKMCLANRWTFEMADYLTIRATCESCAFEVEFMSKKAKKKLAQGGESARGPEKHIGDLACLFNPAAIGDGIAPWN